MSEVINTFLRPSTEIDGLPSARFEFMGIDCLLTVDKALGLHVQKLGARGAGKTIASGKARLQAVEPDSKKPDFVGAFSTPKKTVFEVAGWTQCDEITGDTYMSLNIRPYIRKAGWFPSAQQTAPKAAADEAVSE